MRVFPNRFHRDPLVRGGQSLAVPSGAMKFNIRLDEPKTEHINCLGADDRARASRLRSVRQEDLAALSVASLTDLREEFQEAFAGNFAQAKMEIAVR